MSCTEIAKNSLTQAIRVTRSDFQKKSVFLAVMSLTGALFLSHILVNNEINTNNDTVYMAIYGTNNYQIHIHTYLYSNIFLSIYIIPVQHHLENPELGSF